eukprot:4702148-Alexandrium_andersonii.AAC.1
MPGATGREGGPGGHRVSSSRGPAAQRSSGQPQRKFAAPPRTPLSNRAPAAWPERPQRATPHRGKPSTGRAKGRRG